MKFVRREATDIGHIDRTYLASVLFEFYFYVAILITSFLIGSRFAQESVFDSGQTQSLSRIFLFLLICFGIGMTMLSVIAYDVDVYTSHFKGNMFVMIAFAFFIGSGTVDVNLNLFLICYSCVSAAYFIMALFTVIYVEKSHKIKWSTLGHLILLSTLIIPYFVDPASSNWLSWVLFFLSVLLALFGIFVSIDKVVHEVLSYNTTPAHDGIAIVNLFVVLTQTIFHMDFLFM